GVCTACLSAAASRAMAWTSALDGRRPNSVRRMPSHASSHPRGRGGTPDEGGISWDIKSVGLAREPLLHAIADRGARAFEPFEDGVQVEREVFGDLARLAVLEVMHPADGLERFGKLVETFLDE